MASNQTVADGNFGVNSVIPYILYLIFFSSSIAGVPKHINIKNLRADLKSLPHVRMAHGLHVWSLTTNQAAMAVHLCVGK